jgi:Protein of unknown function (DUF3592)
LGVTADTPSSQSSKSTPVTGNAGRWYLFILGLVLALIGGLFVGLMARSFMRAREMRTWPEVACVILSSEIEERQHDENSPLEFRQNLSFGYEWNGQTHTGDRLTLRGSPWSSKRALAEQRVAEYPVGKTTTCRINPADSNFAVIKPDSLAPGYSIWFPALFVVGGLGISFRSLVRKRDNLNDSDADEIVNESADFVGK